MEDMLNNQQKIRFSGAGYPYQNWAAERTTKMVVTIKNNILIHDALIRTNDTLSTDFVQCKWTMMYESKVGSLIFSIVYKLLGNIFQYMFCSQG